jgi:hypothetical protein
LSIRRKIKLAVLCVAAATAACGESESAKRLGAQPKQTIDKVTTDLNRNLQQGPERTREAEEKK